MKIKLITMAAAVALAAPLLAHDFQEATTAPARAAAVAEADLAKPPASGAQTFVITSTGGTHGKAVRWAAPDGSRWSRESLLLRGFKTEIDQRTKLAADGSISELAIRGTTPSGDAAEKFAGGAYESPVDKGRVEGAGAFYVPYGGLMEPTLLLAEALYRAPGKTLALAPSGRATLVPLTTLEVSNGKAKKKLTAYSIDGLSIAPTPVWFEGDRLFGVAGFLNFFPDGWASVATQLSQAQDAAIAEQAPALLAKIAPKVAGPVVFNNVRMYDADAGRFRDGMTVVAEGGKITNIVEANEPIRLVNAKVIDGSGKTLVPGLWDAHQHYGFDASGPLLLSTGVTSVRDPGNRPEESIARKARIDNGQLLGPRIIPVMLIDGVGPMAAQMAVNATDEASALAAVKKAKDMGFTGVKLYGSLDPKLVPVIAGEAKKLGLRVQGHVPRTMRPLDAVRAGYDELTHINFVMMQAMPDAVIEESNGLQRFYGPGRYAADVDLNGTPMRAYINELAQRKTVVDPTLAIFEGGFTADTGEIQAMYKPYDGLLPPVIGRALKGGSFAPTAEVSREQMRASYAKLQQLVVALYRAGVPIVAGTDGAGIELIRDLELYVDGGLTPAEALATATIIPSRVFGVDDERGSIAIGKLSDLVLVDGDPSRRIGDLRYVDTVLLGDRLMKGDALRTAAGISGRPK
ncbi:amidohydrolase family protein [Sphingoaurantiacus capsulatus]|uniref:Amidohydrolase family protein n=1 Tax=Sphingoaurantiacus capsulatus TaxID=1771310 RepID=A0ABV7XF92_9SPHN